MSEDAAMLRATADAVDGNGRSPLWWLAQAIELRALADRLDLEAAAREIWTDPKWAAMAKEDFLREASQELGLVNGCNNPNHSEPFACYRQAEGGFVCESTHQLEKLIYAIPGNGEAIAVRWNEGVIEQHAIGDMQWHVLLDPESRS